MKRLRIGITIGLRSADESLWVNGIKQNALFLALALQASPWQHVVTLVNTTAVDVSGTLPWSRERFPTAALADVIDHLDVLIELGAQVDLAQTERLRTRGTRLVSYCCGSEYVAGVEAMLFDRPLWRQGWFVNPHFDALWFIPQVARHTLPFLQTLRRAPASVVPFVWDPFCLEAACAELPHQGCYVPEARAWPPRVAVMEPNINVIKTCVVPVFAVEHAYRRAPEAIAQLVVCNALDLAHRSPEFQIVMNQLDIVRDGKALFTDRHATAPFLSSWAEAIVSHQWDNPLNYFYFDVAWLGYPLVHNAPLCRPLGWFYRHFDAAQAGERLLQALPAVRDNPRAYREAQRAYLQRFTAANPRIPAAYDDLLSAWF
ncbi:MAG: DUF2827 family protein [Burkholderiales bacterium]|nr:MAG: DUF2827 family protein [Burkholderiales bacterium]